MRAARIFEDLSLRVDELADPAPGPGEVLVRIQAAGVCGTDLHILDGMIKPDPYPMTIGHEEIFAWSSLARCSATQARAAVGSRRSRDRRRLACIVATASGPTM